MFFIGIGYVIRGDVLPGIIGGLFGLCLGICMNVMITKIQKINSKISESNE